MPDIAEQFGTGGWQFTPEVAEVFPEHVRASVPFYDSIQDLIAEASDWLVPPAATSPTSARRRGSPAVVSPNATRTGVSRSTSTTISPRCSSTPKTALRALPGGQRGLFHAARIQDGLTHTSADLTLILFTLQFLTAPDRVTALRHARERAAKTGALIVAEKIRPRDSRWAEIGNDVSHDWKAAHGIPDAAIRAKARALRGVLVPHTQDRSPRRLGRPGGSHPRCCSAGISGRSSARSPPDHSPNSCTSQPGREVSHVRTPPLP